MAQSFSRSFSRSIQMFGGEHSKLAFAANSAKQSLKSCRLLSIEIAPRRSFPKVALEPIQIARAESPFIWIRPILRRKPVSDFAHFLNFWGLGGVKRAKPNVSIDTKGWFSPLFRYLRFRRLATSRSQPGKYRFQIFNWSLLKCR